MFSFTNKKAMDVWSSEVKCIKWMEKSEVIQKTLQRKYMLISYHFYMFLICIDFTAQYKINSQIILDFDEKQ